MQNLIGDRRHLPTYHPERCTRNRRGGACSSRPPLPKPQRLYGQSLRLAPQSTSLCTREASPHPTASSPPLPRGEAHLLRVILSGAQRSRRIPSLVTDEQITPRRGGVSPPVHHSSRRNAFTDNPSVLLRNPPPFAQGRLTLIRHHIPHKAIRDTTFVFTLNKRPE